MAYEFKVGDVVRLRSGGPAMTIIAFRERLAHHDDYTCVWIDDQGREHQLILPEVALKK